MESNLDNMALELHLLGTKGSTYSDGTFWSGHWKIQSTSGGEL
jgi:hypothetical protein